MSNRTHLGICIKKSNRATYAVFKTIFNIEFRLLKSRFNFDLEKPLALYFPKEIALIFLTKSCDKLEN